MDERQETATRPGHGMHAPRVGQRQDVMRRRKDEKQDVDIRAMRASSNAFKTFALTLKISKEQKFNSKGMGHFLGTRDALVTWNMDMSELPQLRCDCKLQSKQNYHPRELSQSSRILWHKEAARCSSGPLPATDVWATKAAGDWSLQKTGKRVPQ